MTVGICGLSGQTQTTDGLEAMKRGDFSRAVEILKPIAEDWRADDALAQLLLARLYEGGFGVAADPIRACALYRRASSKLETPIGQEAGENVRRFISRGKEFNDRCYELAWIGLANGFEPVTFELTSENFVEWTTPNTATVTYANRTRQVSIPLWAPGARFLAIRHTQLATGALGSEIQHFIEAFLWEPSNASGTWNLRWDVFEVVRDELLRIHTTNSSNFLVSVAAAVPPSRDALDVRDYAVLRVNNDGYAEWAVLKGQRPSVEEIPTAAERREALAQKLAREEALKQVDWTRPYEVRRSPAMTYSDADGCGQIQVYGWSRDRAEAVVVRADVSDLTSPSRAQAIDLAQPSTKTSVQVFLYATAQRRFDFCTDVGTPIGPVSIGPETWHAIAGSMAIEISPQRHAGAPLNRRATITLRNVVLRSATGTTVRVVGPVTLSAVVGSLFG